MNSCTSHPYTITLFLLALTFTVLVIISRPEKQVDIAFGGDAYRTKEISLSEMRFRRFMAIACGLASMGAMVTGDIFNFTLFTAMVGITNVGIVAAVKSPHVQDAAYQYGLVALSATVPLFAGAAVYAACDRLAFHGRTDERNTAPCPADRKSHARDRCDW